MENQKQEWYIQTAKFQEEVATQEYSYSDGSGKTGDHYTILEHEYVVLFDRLSGEYKVRKPTVETTNTP